MLNKDNNSVIIKFLIQRLRSCQEKIKRNLDYSVISLLLIISLYNVLLYNLKILEISWDGAAHANDGILLYDMIREVIIRDRNFSPFEIYRYLLIYNYAWYPTLGRTIATYPLFIPFLFMLSYSFFGISFASAYLVVIVMGNICIIVTFLLGAELFDRRVGLLAALLLAFSSVFFAFSKTALLDVPSATMFTLSIYSLIIIKKRIRKKQKLNKQSFLSGLLIGLAFMTRPECLLIFPVIILYFLLNYVHKIKNKGLLENYQKLTTILKSNLWIFYGIIPALLLISFQMGIFVFSGSLRIWIAYANQESNINPIAIRNWFFYIIEIGLSIPELGGILCGLAYALYRRTKMDRLLLSWYFVIYATLSVMLITEARYAIILFPVMFILLSRVIVKISDRFKTYHPRAVNVTTIAVIIIIFFFGFVETLQYPYAHYYSGEKEYSHMPVSETPMEEAALFLIENNARTMQMTMNPTISPSGMTFYILKHDRDHKTRYYDIWWATNGGNLTIEEFRDLIKQFKISHLLISDPGIAPWWKNLDKYVNFVLENPEEFSLVKIFEEEHSIYIYKVHETF